MMIGSGKGFVAYGGRIGVVGALCQNLFKKISMLT